jgi:GNAT superfamily N-acetyltransferase
MADPILRLVRGEDAAGYRDAIVDPLVAYNVAAGGTEGWELFALLIEDPETGSVSGGAFGETIYGWTFLKLLVVPEDRRRSGLGTRIMAEVEAFAREAGSRGVWLDTFDFQARPFYEKLGYRVFGELEDGPQARGRYFLKKVF